MPWGQVHFFSFDYDAVVAKQIGSTIFWSFFSWGLKRIYPYKVSKWYFVSKIVLSYYEKKCSSDLEKLLKFEAEGWDFSKFLRSLEQIIWKVKGHYTFETEYFLICSGV